MIASEEGGAQKALADGSARTTKESVERVLVVLADFGFGNLGIAADDRSKGRVDVEKLLAVGQRKGAG